MSALAKNYNRRKIAFTKGKGSFLYSTSGKKYLDFVQGIAVNSLGHANPYLIKAINAQAKKVWHVSNAFIIPEGEKLAKRLSKKTDLPVFIAEDPLRAVVRGTGITLKNIERK